MVELITCNVNVALASSFCISVCQAFGIKVVFYVPGISDLWSDAELISCVKFLMGRVEASLDRIIIGWCEFGNCLIVSSLHLHFCTTKGCISESRAARSWPHRAELVVHPMQHCGEVWEAVRVHTREPWSLMCASANWQCAIDVCIISLWALSLSLSIDLLG